MKRRQRAVDRLDVAVDDDERLARIREAIFQGSSERMFAQMVSDKKLSRKELERMRALLARRLSARSSARAGLPLSP